MTQEQRLDALLRILLDMQPSYSGMKTPASYDQRQLRLRSLMNVWQPSEMPDEYWKLQDDYLQAELSFKTVTGAAALPAVPLHPKLSLWQGDITTLQADAIVNAANSALLGCFIPCHGCIDNAIHSAAGLQLRMACHQLMQGQAGGEPTGRARLTKGYNLPCKYVLHTVGPIVRGTLTEKACNLLSDCYRACLELAQIHGLRSIAFCCISTGEFHFPNDRAAQIAVQTVVEYLDGHSGTTLKKVIFNVFKTEDYDIYKAILGTN